MWQWLSDMYPFWGAPDITPAAAMFQYAEERHIGANARSPPPFAATIHCMTRPELARHRATPIHAAAFDGRAELVLPLLDLDTADVTSAWTVTTDSLLHPVHAAALGGRVALTRLLLNLSGLIKDEDGRGVSHFAAASRYSTARQLMEELLPAGEWSRQDGKMRTPLHYAAETGTLAMVTFLLGTSPHACYAVTNYSELPLHFAAASGYIDKFNAIFAAMQINGDQLTRRTTFFGASVVHYALHSDNVDMVKHCIKYYDDDWSLVRETGMRAGGLLKCAGHSSNPAVFAYAKRQLEHRLPAADDDGWTPLHSACAAGCLRMVRFLITTEHYSPYAIDRDGYTILHAAVSSNSPTFFDEVARLVNDDIRSRHFTSQDSLGSLALNANSITMLQHLVASGYCDLSTSPKTRRTTYLMEAVRNHGSIRMVEWLLRQGHRPWDDTMRGLSVVAQAERSRGKHYGDAVSALKEKYPQA